MVSESPSAGAGVLMDDAHGEGVGGLASVLYAVRNWEKHTVR